MRIQKIFRGKGRAERQGHAKARKQQQKPIPKVNLPGHTYAHTYIHTYIVRTDLCIFRSLSLSLSLSRLAIYLSTYLCISLSIHLSIFLSTCFMYSFLPQLGETSGRHCTASVAFLRNRPLKLYRCGCGRARCSWQLHIVQHVSADAVCVLLLFV